MMSYVGTTTVLTGAATYTSPDMMTNRDDRVTGTVFANQDGTLFIEQGYPAEIGGTISWDVSTSYAITASAGNGFSEELVAPKWRIRFLNGATPQTVFRLNANARSDGDS